MIKKIKVLDGGKGQVSNPYEIGEYEWGNFDKANPAYDIIGPLSVKVGETVSATLVNHCFCTNEAHISNCDNGNDFECERQAWQLTPEKEGEEKPTLETPNNPRDVLVYVTNCGWMMGNYENGVWRLYFADKGLSIIDNEQDLINWHELPESPQGAKDRTAFTITSPLISLFNVERALYDYWSDLDEEEPNYHNALNAIKNYKDE